MEIFSFASITKCGYVEVGQSIHGWNLLLSLGVLEVVFFFKYVLLVNEKSYETDIAKSFCVLLSSKDGVGFG